MQSTNEFVHSQNVLHLKRRLSVEADQDRRNVLLTLLAEEEAKLHNGKEKREAVRSESLRKTEGLAT
jgi:hypothetical protein